MKMWRLLVALLVLVLGSALAQPRPRVVIPTGSTGGVFFWSSHCQNPDRVGRG